MTAALGPLAFAVSVFAMVVALAALAGVLVVRARMRAGAWPELEHDDPDPPEPPA